MPARMRAIMARMRRGVTGHKVTAAVFGISLAAILALGILAGRSSSGPADASSSGANSSTSSAQSLIGQKAPAFNLAALAKGVKLMDPPSASGR